VQRTAISFGLATVLPAHATTSRNRRREREKAEKRLKEDKQRQEHERQDRERQDVNARTGRGRTRASGCERQGRERMERERQDRERLDRERGERSTRAGTRSTGPRTRQPGTAKLPNRDKRCVKRQALRTPAVSMNTQRRRRSDCEWLPPAPRAENANEAPSRARVGRATGGRVGRDVWIEASWTLPPGRAETGSSRAGCWERRVGFLFGTLGAGRGPSSPGAVYAEPRHG